MKKGTMGIILCAAAVCVLLLYFGLDPRETKVKFEKVAEKELPRRIEAEIIPEYRDLERALACEVDGSVYVLVTRGEKPTAGYEVEIDKIALKSEDNMSKLIVYADFTDPEEPENMAQSPTFPFAAGKTKLRGLPDKIELRAKYVDKKD